MSVARSYLAGLAGARVLSLLFGFGILLAVGPTAAQTPIDNTCATCDRRQLDSLNYHDVKSIRVNQVGYRTQDYQKVAFVGSATATPPGTTYKVIDESGATAWNGNLQSLGKFDGYRARMHIVGYYNSINALYSFGSGDTTQAKQAEYLWKVDFGGLTRDGMYRVVVGRDTSHEFGIRETIYNDVFETSLKFFGAQRCGATNSWFHKDCHTKDGSALGHEGELQGGWHDCGDHGKYGETEGYAASMLALAYTAMPEKAEDRYGASYNDTLPFGTDGIPDLLWEAKVGADYIYKLYARSKAEGLIARSDMYHTVGNGPGMDHLFWDKPENQDAQAQSKGGPHRPVLSGIGTNVAGMYAVSLALVGRSWEPFDPVYSKQMVDAAIDIYDNIIIKKLYAKTTTMCCYDGGGQLQDDPAFAAVALWYATGQSRFGHDLYANTAHGTNAGSVFSPGMFAAGLLSRGPITGTAKTAGYFDLGGWTTDFQQTNQLAIYAFGKLILKDTATASKYGINSVLRDSLLFDVIESLRRGVSIGSNGPDNTTYPGINVHQPYHGVFDGGAWGYNRYNMGKVVELFMYWDLEQRTHFWQSMKGKTVPARLLRPEFAARVNGWTEAVDSMYLRLGIDNLNYQLGVNPWDMSFIMGAGSKNLQHPHNRAANPEGYNAGGVPYKYRVPKGALMGGCRPGELLLDMWDKYTVTETCIDFSAQLIIPTQMLAKDLPPDTVGPEFKNVVVVDIRDVSALVTWQTNELSRDTLFYSLTPGGPTIGSVAVNLAKNKSAFLPGLTPNTTYYFWFKGMDIYRNVSRDDNRGRYYQFTTLIGPPPAPKIYDVRVCNIRSDRATVFWWTDIVSSSTVEFAEEGKPFATSKTVVARDDEGIPGRFHKVTITGLKPGTAYRYDVISGLAKDDSAGLHRRFETTQDFADYTIMMKATTKNKTTSGDGAHFYLLITNNEPKPYAGLELRVYFKATAAVARAMVVNTSDNAIWGGGGVVIGTPKLRIGSAVAYGASGDVWYFPITIDDTIPVSGSVRVEMKMDSTNWKPVSFPAFANGWSFAPHAAPPDPVAFPGIDMAKPWAGPEQIEKVNGTNYVTYTEDPYITAHFKGVHIYGYPPDGAKPRVFRNTRFTFTGPLPSPATSVRQDSVPVHFGGRTWSFPDVVNAQWQVDAPLVRASTPLAAQTDSVAFRHDTLDAQGPTAHEFAFWGDRDSTYCSCAWQRYLVVVDTQRAIYNLKWTPDSAKSAKVGTRIPYVITMSDSAGIVKAGASIAVVSSNPYVSFYTTATGGTPTNALTMVNGTATVWVTSDSAVSSVILTATGSASGAVITPAVSQPVTFAFETYRLEWVPSVAKTALVGKRIPLTIVLASDSLDTVKVAGVVGVISNKPNVYFYASETGTTPANAFSLVGGTVTIWVSSDSAVDTARLTAATTIARASVSPGISAPVTFTLRVPPRYSLTWNPDTTRTSLVGSRLPYTLLLTPSDTFGIAGVAGTVALSSNKAGILFYDGPMSTTPVTTLPVVAGKAAVWVSSSAPVDSATLRADGAVVDAVVDSGRTRWVSFLVPPPWPVIDSARTQDADCDGSVERVELFLSMRPGTSRFAGLVILLGQDTAKGVITWNTDSTKATMTLSAPLAGTGRQGNATLWWTAVASGNRDTLVFVQAPVRDRVGPRMVSASILENFRPATTADTLRVEFSEPVRAPVTGWPFAAVLPASPILANGRMITPTVWEWTIGPGVATTVTAGQILRGGVAATLVDTSGNPGAGCGTDTATVQLRTRPVPLKSGAVLDLDGDGRADAVHLRYERGLRTTELPDSVRVSWGGIVARFPVTVWTRGTDSSLLVAPIAPQWSVSADAFAKATATKGAGANLWIDSIALTDSVGPSLAAAVLRFGTTNDTLLVRGNEAVSAMVGVELLRKQTVLTQAISREIGADGTFRLVFASGLLQDGDSVRFSGVWKDATGNVAAPAAPWVAVLSGDRPPLDAWMVDTDGDGRADAVHLRWDRPIKRKHGYVFSWPSGSVMATRTTDMTEFVMIGTMAAVVTITNPFPFGATGLEGAAAAPARQIESILPGWTDSIAFSVRDSVDPTVVSAELHYSSKDGELDTLIARFSESLLLAPVNPAVVLHAKGVANPETPVVNGVVVMAPDGRSALLFLNPLDSNHTAFSRGDSVRIAPAIDAAVKDAFGNIAEGASPWVKVTFGARPSRFKITMHPKAMHQVLPGETPLGEQVILLVRPRGGNVWKTIDGIIPASTEGRIGPMISINGGFGGLVRIYDNLGVSVAGIDLAMLEIAWNEGRIPSDPSGQYDVWVSWNGASSSGKMVGSGVYTTRLALRRNVAAPDQMPRWEWTNDLIRFGWRISLN